VLEIKNRIKNIAQLQNIKAFLRAALNIFRLRCSETDTEDLTRVILLTLFLSLIRRRLVRTEEDSRT